MSLIDRRRPAFTADLVLRAALVWLVVAVIFVATSWRAIATLDLPDADDTLRMVQVRDLLAGQGWWDLHQYRVDPPAGMLMHWSRLVDLPLYLVQLGLRPLVGAMLAERIALVAVPLLTLGCALLLAARLAWRILGDETIFYACLVLAMATPVSAQVQPLRIDHHGWQIVAVLAALNGFTARTGARSGWIAGAALAVGMTISLELLPVAALFGGVLVLRALRDPQERAAPAAFLQALALVGLGGFLATHGLADLASHCDTLSPAYLGALVVAALGTSVLAAAPALPRVPLAAGYALCGAAAAATLLALAPACAAGPFGALDPLVRRFWYLNVFEGRPVWFQTVPVIAQMLLPPLVGLLAAVRLALDSRGWLRRFWGEYAVLLAGLIVLAVLVARSSAFAGAAGAVPLAWQLRQWHRRARALRRPVRRVLGLLGMAAVVMPGVPLLAAARLVPAGTDAAPATPAQRVCDMPAVAPALDRLPPATIFAPLDIGPMVLAYTHHRVVATAHHRAPRAMHDVIAGAIADPAAARAIVAAHGARYVAVCPGLIEVENYRLAAPRGLMADLAAGRTPAWLKPVPLPGHSGLLVWEVVAPPPGAAPGGAGVQTGRNSSAAPFMQ